MDIEFRPPRYWSRQVLIFMLPVQFGVLSIIAVAAFRDYEHMLWGRFAVVLALVLVIPPALTLVGRRLWMRFGVAPSIHFGADGILLPANTLFLGTTKIGYTSLRSINLVGRLWNERIAISTVGRTDIFYPGQFQSAGPLSDLIVAARRHVLASSGGEELWDQIERRNQLAIELRSSTPWITWTLVAVIVSLFVLQTFLVRPNDYLGPIAFGANAPVLVANGEWYRLASANFLHASFWHLFLNVIYLLIIGSVVERLIGSVRYVILVLLIAFVDLLISTAVGIWLGRYLFSLGISGVICGLLGTFLILNRRYREVLPGGYILVSPVWKVLLSIGFVIPLVTPGTDNAAHWTGLLVGLLAGLLLSAEQPELPRSRAVSLPTSLVAAALVLIFACCFGLAIRRASDPALREADRTIVLQAAAKMPAHPISLDNDIAWSVATDPAAFKAQFAIAKQLEERALAKTTEGSKEWAKYTDTLAIISGRQGDFERAISLEEKLLTDDSENYVIAGHLARFLQRAYRVKGIIQTDNYDDAVVSAQPVLKARAGGIDVILPRRLPQGFEIYALDTKNGQLVGLVHHQQLPSEKNKLRYHVTDISAHDLTVVRFSLNGCNCHLRESNLFYWSLEPKMTDLP